MSKIYLLFFSALLLLTESFAAEPLSVLDAVRRAREIHPNVVISAEIIEEAKGERRSDLSLPAPTIALESEGVPRGGGLSDYEEQRLSFSQELEFPLRYMWRTRSANAAVKSARYESQAIMLDLESDIRLTYLEAWLLNEQVRILAENADAANTYSGQTQRLLDLGETSLLDSRRARVETLEAQKELESAKRARIAVFSRLGRLTDIDPKTIDLRSPLDDDPIDSTLIATIDPPFDLNPPDFRVWSTDEEALPFSSNPEISSLKAEYMIAGYEKKMAVSGWMPDIEFSYFQQRVPGEDEPNFWGSEIGLSVPLWFWWGGKGEIQAAEARHSRAYAELESQRLEVAADWEQWVQELKAAFEEHKLYEQELLPLGRETYELARQSYTLGEASSLEVIDTQRSYLEGQLGYLEAASNLYRSKVQLDRLAGRLISAGSK